MGEDAEAAIRWLGGRDHIAVVHFRNVRVDDACRRYAETFIDDGDCDMAACAGALQEADTRA